MNLAMHKTSQMIKNVLAFFYTETPFYYSFSDGTPSDPSCKPYSSGGKNYIVGNSNYQLY